MRVVKTKQMVPRARGPLEGGLPTPANPVANDRVAPKPDLPAPATDRGGSTSAHRVSAPTDLLNWIGDSGARSLIYEGAAPAAPVWPLRAGCRKCTVSVAPRAK